MPENSFSKDLNLSQRVHSTYVQHGICALADLLVLSVRSKVSKVPTWTSCP